MTSHRDMGKIDFNLREVVERISSGKKLNKGADNPGGLAISAIANAHIRGVNVAIENAQDVMNFVRAGEYGMNNITDLLVEMRSLAVRAANEAPATQRDRDKLDSQFQKLYDQLTRTAESITLRGGRDSAGRGQLTPISWQWPGYADIMFVFDYSASMGPYLATLKAEFSEFVETLDESKVNWEIGLVEFSDEPAGQPTIHHDLTPDQAVARAYLDAVAVAGGADPPESALEALDDTLNMTSWRYAPGTDNYSRHAILITDVSAPDETWHDDAAGDYAGDGLSGFDTSSMAATLAAAGVQVHIAGDPSSTQNNLMASGTGGTLGNINGFESALENIRNTIKNQEGVALEPDRSLHAQVSPDNAGPFEFLYEDSRAVGLDMATQDLSTIAGAQSAIDACDAALEAAGDRQARYGAYDRRLQNIVDDLKSDMINTSAANSRIEDADVALETTRLTRNQILSQVNIQAHVGAELSPSSIIELLQHSGLD